MAVLIGLNKFNELPLGKRLMILGLLQIQRESRDLLAIFELVWNLSCA